MRFSYSNTRYVESWCQYKLKLASLGLKENNLGEGGFQVVSIWDGIEVVPLREQEVRLCQQMLSMGSPNMASA